MDNNEKLEQFKKAEHKLYNCAMETAWNWNGRPAEEVRIVYENLIEEAIEDMALTGTIEKSSYDVLAGVKAIQTLDNENKTYAMKAMHHAVNKARQDVERKISILREEIQKDKATL
jgi:hypothetical protein